MNNSTPHRSSSYRPDIDGLRAIAVLSVIFYHFGFGCPGGYVGVDVFFVISGYLISLILFNELRDGRFSLVDFWARRARRILPVLTLVLCVSVGLAWTFTDPLTTSDTLKEAAAQSLFGANIYFNQALDYFSHSSDYRMLLHTWSLSVEEQFYMILPPALLLLFRWNYIKSCSVLRFKIILASILMVVGLVSFVLSFQHIESRPLDVFFLPQYRAWEFLVGTMLALICFKRKRPVLGETASQLAFLFGVVGILYPVAFFTRYMTFPGPTAALPVFGAALVILSGERTHLGTRLLACKPMVGIGLLSYSLYLWHWPLSVILRHNIIDPSVSWYLGVLAATGVFSWLSYKYVETPFRQSKVIKTRNWQLAVGFGVNSLCVIGAGCAFIINQNQAQELSSEIASARTLLEEPSIGFGYRGHGIPFGTDATESDYPVVALWGDSHARAILPTLGEDLKRANIPALAFCITARRPIVGISRGGWSDREFEENLLRQEGILEEILDKKIANVILAARWTNLFHPNPWKDGNDGKPRLVGKELQVRQNEVLDLLSQQIGVLEAQGITVWILRQAPESDISDPTQRFLMFVKNPGFNKFPPTSPRVTIEKHNELSAAFGLVLEQLVMRHSNIKVLDPTDAFFTEKGELKIYDTLPYYRDGDHVSLVGARDLISPTWIPMLEAIDAH